MYIRVAGKNGSMQMRKAILYFFTILIVLLASCNSKSETSEAEKISSYLTDPVGTQNDALYTIINLKAIKKEWEARLDRDYSGIALQDFRIIKGRTEGEAPQDYYILTARSADYKIITASLLTLKDSKFYFEGQHDNNSVVYPHIVCESSCNEGCEPVVKFQNGIRYLNCSPCLDCVKKESEMR